MINYKFITHPYLEKFKCSADKCPSTCCYGWNVKVDNKTLEVYKNLCNSFGDYLVDHISKNNNNIYMNKDYCPFLDSEQMCKIQKKYGLDMLCDTCKYYPRVKKYLINIELESMVLSCPEVINTIKKVNIFDEKIETVEIKGKETKKEKLTLKLYDYFHNKLKFIYNKKAKLNKTIYVLINFAYDVDKYFKQNLTEKNVEEFNNKFDKKYFISLYKEFKIKKDLNFVISSQQSLIKTTLDLDVKNRLLKPYFKDFSKTNFEEINFKKTYKKTIKLLNKNINLYNVFFYILNYEIFNIIKEKDFLSFLNGLITFINLILSLSTPSFINDNLRFERNSIILTSNLYRFLYHSANFDFLISKYNNSNFCNKENLFKYLTSF